MLTLGSGAKLLGAGLTVVLLVWGGECAHDRFKAADAQRTAVVKAQTADVIRTDGVFVTDTLKLARAIAITDTIRRNLVLTDTVRVRHVLTQDSLTIRACVETVSSCAATIRARDALIATLRKPVHTPRLTYDVSGMYDPFKKESLLRGGAEFRAFDDFRGRLEGEYSGVKGFALRAGFRKAF